MKLTTARLRKIIKEELKSVLTEAAKQASDLPEDVYVSVFKWTNKNRRGNAIVVAYTDVNGKRKSSRTDQIWGHIEINSVEPWGDPCEGSAVVTEAFAADGWGPLLYDVAIEVATMKSNGLTADRNIVSQDAAGVWDFYLKNRTDVVSHQLDDLNNTLTPKDEDNCTQDAAGDNWQSSSLSKRYTKKPTTIKALGDKLIWKL
jgi:hypothetical protein